MKEDLVSYIWRYRMWGDAKLTTTQGEPVEVIDVGLPNNGSGPDYFNAKVRIADTLWAGNVEIHVRASDWNRHQHETDAAYNSVILHVVANSDAEVRNQKGDILPQVQLPIESRYISLAEQLRQSHQPIPCGHYWDEHLKTRLQFMMNGLLCERLEHKVVAIQDVLKSNQNDWEETFYQVLAKSFGMKVNEVPFVQLAKSLPQHILAKQKDNLLQIEALLLGQAGLLDNLELTDSYTDQLQAEYKFLRQKYSLTPIDPSLWRMGRIRPASSPYVRLAEFAMLIYNSEHLFRKVVDTTDAKEMHKLFTFGTSEYWQTHYYLAQWSKKSEKTIGEALRNSILINCVVPMLFAYGKQTGNEGMTERVFDLLESIPAENNSIIDTWKNYGVVSHNAYDTQALLEQMKNYCLKKECLRCKLGHQIFKHLPEK